MNEVKIVLPMPPSVNNLFPTNFKTGKRYKSPKYKEWIELALLSNNKKYKIKLGDGKVVEVSYIFYSKWFNKNGTIKKKDMENYYKATTDFLPNIIEGFDDSMIFSYKDCRKIHSDREEVEVFIKEISHKKLLTKRKLSTTIM